MSHAIDNRYAVYAERFTKAAKPRVCDACDRTIGSGHVYAHVFMVDDGTARHVDRCGACQTMHEHLRELDPGEMWPDEQLGCGLDYEDEWGREPPEDIQALPFIAAEESSALIVARYLKQKAVERDVRARRKAAKLRAASVKP